MPCSRGWTAWSAKADTQVFGPEGVMKEARATVMQLNGLLAETRTSLKKVDAVLVEAQGIGANVRAPPPTWALCAPTSRPTCARSKA